MAKKRKSKKKSKRRTNGADGRRSNGQFAKDNTIAKGNLSKTNIHAQELKRALLEAVTTKDIKAICKKMLSQAKDGDNYARKELFDRLWGRAIQEVDLGEETRKTIFDILAVCGLGDDNGD